MGRFLPRVARRSAWVALLTGPLVGLGVSLGVVNVLVPRLVPEPTPTPATVALLQTPAGAAPPMAAPQRSPPLRSSPVPRPSTTSTASVAVSTAPLSVSTVSTDNRELVVWATPTAVGLPPGQPRPTPTRPTPSPSPEVTVHSGEFEARLYYDDGTVATARLRFDLGAPGRVPRLHLVSSYLGPEGEQRVERVTIGGQSWQRTGDGAWSAITDRTGVADQVRAFLPPPEALAAILAGDTQFRARNAQGDAIFLTGDRSTGVPQELLEVRQGSGVARSITYLGWNTPVEVVRPVAP